MIELIVKACQTAHELMKKRRKVKEKKKQPHYLASVATVSKPYFSAGAVDFEIIYNSKGDSSYTII